MDSMGNKQDFSGAPLAILSIAIGVVLVLLSMS